MKIKRLTINNVTSYKKHTEFTFDAGLNILIGTNGGGKTNLQKILALTLSKYFIHQYQFRRNDQEAKIEISDPWTQRALERAFPRYVGDENDQLIEIELVPESTDVQNIRAIGANLESLNSELAYWEKKYDTYEPLPYADEIGRTPSFTYSIRNLKLVEPEPNSAAWAFHEYLKTFFIFVRVAHRLPNLRLNAPVFFFSSDRALSKSFEVQAGQLTEQNYFDGFRSAYQAATGESMNLMQWGAQHFVRLHRNAVIESSNSAQTWRHFFAKYGDVQLLTRYMRQLGYEWDFWHDSDQLSYLFLLAKDNLQFSPDMFSSGEREIVHFLLAMFALNVTGGLVLVDEPELHLHPRWQRIFLGLFRDLAPERHCQFVITTHSPAFVTPDTINSITRVFRTPGEGSSRVALRDVDLPQKKSLVRMINSQNNERLFFADKVVLVEGITDRLVLTSLLESAALQFRNSAAVEIIEVGGKGSFADYRNILRGLLTPSFIVADRDYLSDVGSQATRALFLSDPAKQFETLTRDKKSIDRASLIERLGNAVNAGELDELRKVWDYFSKRTQRLKDPLTVDDEREIERDLTRLRADHIFVLRHGEIEDYLPQGVGDIKSIVEVLVDRNWINRVNQSDRRVELGSIVCSILDAPSNERENFLAQLATGAVQFPVAGSASASSSTVQGNTG